MPPRVSVVIPYLNMGRYLEDALASVRSQGFDAWEILIVDDGSEQAESAVARGLARADSERIRYLMHPGGARRGASASRNLGVREACGEFISLLDADDAWLPGKLDRQVRKLDEHPDVAFTFGRVRYFFEDSPGKEERDQPFGRLEEGTFDPPGPLAEFLRDGSTYPCPSATLVRRSAYLAVGGFEERFTTVKTDLAMWTKLCTRFRVHADHAVLARYRQHAGSSVARIYSGGRHSEYERRYFDWLLRYIEELPADVRNKIEPLACERMNYYAVEKALQGRRPGSLSWRWEVARQLASYPAFWRRGRLIRYLLPGRWQNRPGAHRGREN